jgi:hypothetical protein
MGFYDQIHGGVRQHLLLERLTPAKVPPHDPVSVDDTLELRRRGDTVKAK